MWEAIFVGPSSEKKVVRTSIEACKLISLLEGLFNLLGF